MDRLQSMRVFQAVVDEGSFAAAARKLDLAPAVVTRLVTDLEKHLGVRLLQRTTRRLALTPAGEAYLVRLRAILSDIEAADTMVRAQSQEMSGTLRILSWPVLAVHLLAPAATEFQRRHPDVAVDIHASDAVDPNVEGYDLALLLDSGQLHSSAVVRTIRRSEGIFCAAPEYLRRHGEPATPDDLARHRWVRLHAPGSRLRPLTLIDPSDGDRKLEVEVPAVFMANHFDTLLRAAIEGAGLCELPARLADPALRSGQLRRVLAPWITTRLSLVAVLPTRKFMPARTRAFLEHFAAYTEELAVARASEQAAPSEMRG